ncbi:MAG: hypothetical protein ACLTK0_01285 [Anaerovoracaceae bacterium]
MSNFGYRTDLHEKFDIRISMITDTEGVVLRQVKALGGRRMILLFSKNSAR